MLKKRLISILLVAVLAVASLAAEMLLPFFEFDFDAYIDSYHQLVVNDVYFPGEDTPFYNTLEKALLMFDRNLDESALHDEVMKMDADSLKSYIGNVVAAGDRMTDEEIEDILFDPENMYSAYVSPTTDSAMSYFGHNFLMFYMEDAPMLSPCINFYAYYDHLGALGTVFEGLAGNLVSYYDFKPFYVTYIDYVAYRDRSIAMARFSFDAEPEKVHEVMNGLTVNEYPNYSFLFYNCSHGFMDMLEHMEPGLVFDKDRALSPAKGMQMFSEKDLVGDSEFEFAAWNDIITSRSAREFRDYYDLIKAGGLNYSSDKPFENFTLTRKLPAHKQHVSEKFSSVSFNYGLDGDLNHRMEIWFKPVFNNFGEQNYVDHEIMNLRVLSGGVSARVNNRGQFEFEGFEAELLSFDSIFPFTTLLKRPSFGADLSIGMRDFMFLLETDFYLGMTLGRSDIFWFFGLDNIASTAPLEYTLNFRNMLGGGLGPVSIVNITDMVLFSTLHDYFHIENDLEFKVQVVDALSLAVNWKMWTDGGITSALKHSGTVKLIYNFNLF